MMREQILVIYANRELVKNYSLDKMNSFYDEKLKLQEEVEKLKKNNKKLKEKSNKLKKQNEHFKSTKAYKIWQKYAKIKDKH